MKEEDLFDLTDLVRSLQRLEGNQDCFHTNPNSCGRLDCSWRSLCLKQPDEPKKRDRNFFIKADKGKVGEYPGGESQ